MPLGLRVILVVNLLILLAAAGLVFGGLGAGGVTPQALLVAAVTGTGLVIVELIILLRIPRLLTLARATLYAVMLAQGFLLLALLRDLLTVHGLLTFLGTLVVLVYLIGVRGYLNEDSARTYFGRPAGESGQDG